MSNLLRVDDYFARQAELSTLAPRVPFNVFYNELDWRQGEHFSLIGPTGVGKTNMLIALLPKHWYVSVFATKPRDVTMTRLINSGYKKYKYWRNLDPEAIPRRVIWPPSVRLDSKEIQRNAFREALDKIYLEGNWTVVIDELWYFTNVLGLEQEMRTYLLQGRAMGISLIAATQRPVRVPVEFFDQPTHLMFWVDNDRKNLDRIGEINSRQAPLVRRIVGSLEKYQVLYVNTRSGQMLRTRAPFMTGGEK